jgi:hypothetical protein
MTLRSRLRQAAQGVTALQAVGVGLQGRSIRAVEVGSWRDNDSEKAAETQGAAVKAEKGSGRVGALARLDVRPRHERSSRGGAGRGLTDWGTAHESRPRCSNRGHEERLGAKVQCAMVPSKAVEGGELR